MADRRTEILDTAMRLIADAGMRGLTHRAVDRAAALPAGSTSYYFRTRDALVAGCLHRLLDLDKTQVERPDGTPEPAQPAPVVDPAGDVLDALVEQAVAASVRMITTDGHLTRARYELSLHAIRSAELHEVLLTAGTELRGLIAARLAAVGSPEPARAAEELSALLDGLVFTALIRGPRQPAELREWLRPVIRRLLASYLRAPEGRSSARRG